ncbi:MAG: SDR family NAD(P)-dependent oxidoreductase [Acutalibacteraceae bacterium]|nr:SDR family NAD(P)-dependent oxidoreductase [Acutalibacteraceae bacterium]
MKKIAILTGATGGLGKEFLKQILDENIDEVWAIARNKQRLADLKKEYGDKVVTISLDLSELSSIEQIETMLKENKPFVSYLINNAGIAKMGKYSEFSINEIDKMINVNCKAPVMLSQVCIPYMGKGSKILNISSASAFQPNPYINLYASSKAFERSYSRALNVELEVTGIKSVAVCPGWIDTEMLQKEINGKRVKFPGLVTPEKVVTQAIKDAKKGKDMSVCSLYVKYQHLFVKLYPQRFVMKIWMAGIGKYLKES